MKNMRKYNIPELTDRDCTAYCSICDKPRVYALKDKKLYEVCTYKGILLGAYDQCAVPCALERGCDDCPHYNGECGLGLINN